MSEEDKKIETINMGGTWEEQKKDGSKLRRGKGKNSNKDKLTN